MDLPLIEKRKEKKNRKNDLQIEIVFSFSDKRVLSRMSSSDVKSFSEIQEIYSKRPHSWVTNILIRSHNIIKVFCFQALDYSLSLRLFFTRNLQICIF